VGETREIPATPAPPEATPEAATSRPFTARSVIASTLLGVESSELPVAQLVTMVGLFGINANRARVALSRMVAAGEVETDGNGRYRLVGRLLDRQERQRESLAGRTRPWDGTWTMVVVTGGGRAADERAALRRDLALARLGELREGVWVRPSNLDLRPDPAEGSGADGLCRFSTVPQGGSAELAARLWDLEGWARRARTLLDRMEDEPTERPDDLAASFDTSASVLRLCQADPLLPEEILPGDWPGSLLRQRYAGWDRRYRRLLHAWGGIGARSGDERPPPGGGRRGGRVR
jgi:phenylacetic acid degradation operon negative regulatory protein